MNTQAFWNVIGHYNQSTWALQIALLGAIILSLLFACRQKAVWLPKLVLGAANLFIGFIFFLYYGTEPIQKYFAFPLFIMVGSLFLWEALKRRKSAFNKFTKPQLALLGLVIAYPFVSMLLGHVFPQLVVYIMPCPLISLSIVIYSGYNDKNKILLALMSIWGITGVKAFFVNAFEDIILLISGFYCLYIFIKELKRHRSAI